jgi:hypothetical protein
VLLNLQETAMNTPPRKQRVTTPSTSLSAEDKERLIENLDIEGKRVIDINTSKILF